MMTTMIIMILENGPRDKAQDGRKWYKGDHLVKRYLHFYEGFNLFLFSSFFLLLFKIKEFLMIKLKSSSLLGKVSETSVMESIG